MIHSVKDFVDKKMNNKLICFNNVLDDYLFFYDKTKKDDYYDILSNYFTVYIDKLEGSLFTLFNIDF
ncbi:MAG: hypothetical protein EGR78_11980 [Erysipelotrichaceae bacterium]|nr:hypothetical protein [Erysipelotrichaceae bacterium]